MHQLTPERQFAQRLAADPASPLITYYDEASGERTELSARSLANWVAKTHHLLGDELGLGVGDTALVALPAHWLSAPMLLGCLTAGLALTGEDASASVASVAFVTTGSAGLATGLLDAFAIAPDSPFAALGLRGVEPDGVSDYVLAVRPQADAWASVAMPAGSADPCVPGLTRGEVAQRAASADLPAGARVLTTREWTGPHDWIETLLAPIAVGGSVVFVRNCADETVLARRLEQERATVRL